MEFEPVTIDELPSCDCCENSYLDSRKPHEFWRVADECGLVVCEECRPDFESNPPHGEQDDG